MPLVFFSGEAGPWRKSIRALLWDNRSIKEELQSFAHAPPVLTALPKCCNLELAMKLPFHKLVALVWLVVALPLSFGPIVSFVVCIEQEGHITIEPAGMAGRCDLDGTAAQSLVGDDCRACVDLAIQTDVGRHTSARGHADRLSCTSPVPGSQSLATKADPGRVPRGLEYPAVPLVVSHLRSTILRI